MRRENNMSIKKNIKKATSVIMIIIFLLNNVYIASARESIVKEADIEIYDNDEQNLEDSDNSSDGKNNENNENNFEEFIVDDNILTSAYEDMELNSNLTLQDNIEVNNLIINKGTVLKLNGYALTVKGSIELKGGSIDLNNGYIVCENDVTIDRGSSLNMDNINDRLVVKGDFKADNIVVKSGIVELYGDFIVGSKFTAGDSNKFIFEGNDKQTISMSNDSSFNILEIKNFSDDGIYIDYALGYKQLTDNNCNITYNDLGGERGFTLEEDTEIDGMYYLVTDKLDLNGYTLTINGDFVHGGGEVYLNGGSLIVNGNYISAKLVKDDNNNPDEKPVVTYTYEAGTGSLTMNNRNDYMYVSGSYTNNLSNRSNVNLTEGIMEIKGDVDVKFFKASNNHTLYLTGDEAQNININEQNNSNNCRDYYDSNNTYIYNLQMNNTSDEGVTFAQVLCVCGEIEQNSTRVNGSIGIYNTTSFTENQYTGDIYIVNYNMSKNFSVYGDVYINSVTINNKLNVFGDVKVNSLTLYDDLNVYGNINKGNVSEGCVSLRNGNLYVSGDSNNIAYTDYTDTEVIINIDGSVVLPSGSLGCTTLEVKGDISAAKQINIRKLILSGDGNQAIYNSYCFNIETLVLNNFSEDGIHSDNFINAGEIIDNGISIIYDNYNAVGDWTLDKDEIYDGDLIINDGEINLNGHKLYVNGEEYGEGTASTGEAVEIVSESSGNGDEHGGGAGGGPGDAQGHPPGGDGVHRVRRPFRPGAEGILI